MQFRAFSLATVVLAAGIASAADVTVRPLRVTEQRSTFEGSGKEAAIEALRAGIQRGSTLSITLELQGKSLSAASQYGELVVSAKHNKGGSLKQQTRVGLVDISKEFAVIEDRHGEDVTRPDRIVIDLEFEAPPRDATTLTSVEGSLKLLSGDSKEVKLAGVVGKQGKLADKTLTEAGLVVTLLKPTKEQAENPAAALVLEVTGDMSKLVDLYLLDAQGEDIDAGFSSEGDPAAKKTTLIFEADKPLPKDAVLMLEVIPKLDKMEVPIKLSNIKLP